MVDGRDKQPTVIANSCLSYIQQLQDLVDLFMASLPGPAFFPAQGNYAL